MVRLFDLLFGRRPIHLPPISISTFSLKYMCNNARGTGVPKCLSSNKSSSPFFRSLRFLTLLSKSVVFIDINFSTQVADVADD